MIHFVLGSDSKSGRRCEGLAACWSWYRWQQAAPPASGRQASSCCAPKNWRESGWRVGAEGAMHYPAGTLGWEPRLLPKPEPGLMLMWVTPASAPPHDFPAVIPGLSPIWWVPQIELVCHQSCHFCQHPTPTLIFPFSFQVQNPKVICAFRSSTRVQ